MNNAARFPVAACHFTNDTGQHSMTYNSPKLIIVRHRKWELAPDSFDFDAVLEHPEKEDTLISLMETYAASLNHSRGRNI